MDTYVIMIYQEQVMRIAMDLAAMARDRRTHSGGVGEDARATRRGEGAVHQGRRAMGTDEKIGGHLPRYEVCREWVQPVPFRSLCLILIRRPPEGHTIEFMAACLVV